MADIAVGAAPVDAHVVLQGVLVGVAPLAYLTAELLGSTVTAAEGPRQRSSI